MLRRLSMALFAFAFLTLFAQEALTNETVLKLVKAGLGDEVIVGMVKAQPSNFSLNTDDVIALKGGGASDKVVAAMIAKGAGMVMPRTDAARPDAAAPTENGMGLPDELGVYYLKDANYATVTPEILNLRTARGAQMLVGIAAAAKLNGYVTNPHSRTHLAPDTTFVVKLPEGTDPAEYVCLRFTVKNDRREVELARGRINMSTGTQRSAIQFTSEKLAKQVYRIKFMELLKVGEFGLLPPGANISSNASSAGKIYTFSVE